MTKSNAQKAKDAEAKAAKEATEVKRVDTLTDEERAKEKAEAKVAKEKADAAKALAARERAAKEAHAALPPYYVAKGKTITCKKGVLEYLDAIKVTDLGGGQASLDKLVTDGHVIKK